MGMMSARGEREPDVQWNGHPGCPVEDGWWWGCAVGRSRTVSRDRKEKAGEGSRRDVIPAPPPWEVLPESMKLFIPKNFYGDEAWAPKRVLPLQTALSPTHPGNISCPKSPSFPNTYYVLETWNDSLYISALLSLATAQGGESSYLQIRKWRSRGV